MPLIILSIKTKIEKNPRKFKLKPVKEHRKTDPFPSLRAEEQRYF